MKEIPLTKGYVAIVDDEDYEYLSKLKWCCSNGYARKGLWNGGNQTTIAMHRMIMGVLDNEEVEVDHINGNPLDNRRENLRICVHAENLKNSRKRKPTNSTYKGIEKNGLSWSARIMVDGKKVYIGNYKTAEEAAYAYDCAALKLHGEYANINGISKPSPSPFRGKSKYRGVYLQNDRWVAVITFSRKKTWIGSFKTETEAAIAYNNAAIKLKGDKAKLNIID